MRSFRLNTIILGDDIGVPILKLVANKMDLEILGVMFSKKVSTTIKENLQNSLEVRVIETSPISNSNLVLLELINKERVDLILMFSYDVILNREIIEFPGIRIVNIHGGKIPEYRGSNVLNWAIINGEKEIGVTIHEAKLPVDSGPIIGEWSISLENTDTALSIRGKICDSVLERSPRILSNYFRSKKSLIPPRKIKTLAYRKRVPDDGLFDWNLSDIEIHNLIRGLVHPWPGARYIDKNGQLRIIDQYMNMEEIKYLRKLECS